VEALAQRAAVIIAGRVVEAGPVSELGGRQATPAAVSFTRTDSLTGLALPRLPGDAAVEEQDDGRVVVRTHHPTEAMGSLLPWAEAAGVRELTELRIHRPSLEEIYLDLIRRNQEGGVV
jgi:ABC-2 type transport system ATP-binding protein